MAVIMLYTWHFPYETICLFWFLRVEMRWIMAFYLIVDLHPVLLTLAGDRYYTGIAHAAHLGGLAFGFFYGKYQLRLDIFGDRVPFLRWKRKYTPRLRLVTESLASPEPDAEMSQIDELLRKITASGQASLTDEELRVLRSASERLKNRKR
jgi:hypothetical protein